MPRGAGAGRTGAGAGAGAGAGEAAGGSVGLAAGAAAAEEAGDSATGCGCPSCGIGKTRRSGTITGALISKGAGDAPARHTYSEKTRMIEPVRRNLRISQ